MNLTEMEPREIKIKGSNISYFSSGSGEKTIIFLHGNSLSKATFINQFNDVQLQDFRLIALDFPGHGNSEYSTKPETDYSLISFMDIVLEFIRLLEIGDFIFAGHSLGGHVAIECLPFANCKGIIIWGTPPVSLPLDTSELFMPHPDLPLIFKQYLSEKDMGLIAEMFIEKEYQSEVLVALKLSDPMFRKYYPSTLAQGLISDEMEILRQTNIPVSIFHGNNDDLVNYEYLQRISLPVLWHNKISIVEGAGHTPQLSHPTIFNQQLFEYCNHVFD